MPWNFYLFLLITILLTILITEMAPRSKFLVYKNGERNQVPHRPLERRTVYLPPP